MSYLDYRNIVDKHAPAANTFLWLCVDRDGVRSVGLESRTSGGSKEPVATDATKLRLAHHLDGFTSVCTPPGSAHYVANALGHGQRAATVQLPLSVHVVAKECKGEATAWKSESAHTHKYPIQPTSHHCSPTRAQAHYMACSLNVEIN